MPKRIEDQPKKDSGEYEIFRLFVEEIERVVQEGGKKKPPSKEGHKKHPPVKT